jgi:hypothetical protein
MPIIATLGLLASTAAAAAPVEVTHITGTGTYPDLATAMAAAPAGATLTLTAGEHGDLTVESGTHVRIEATQGARVDSVTVGGDGTVAELSGLVLSDTDHVIEVKGGTLLLTDSVLSRLGSSSGYAMRVAPGAAAGLVNVEVTDSEGASGVILAEAGASIGVVDSRFLRNRGTTGGAIRAVGATVAVEGSFFQYNTATAAGGAIAVEGGSLTLTDVELVSSEADRGGAVFVGAGASLVAEDVDFLDNTATTGGHVLVDHASASLTRVRLETGSANHGGGVAIFESAVSVRNTMVAANAASASGGGFFLDGGSLDMAFLTIAGNTAGLGAGVAAERGTAALVASVAADNEGVLLQGRNATISVASSIIAGMHAGGQFAGPVSIAPTVVDADPGFLDGPGHDFAPTLQSAALDAGFEGQADPDGTPADWGMYGGDEAEPLYDLDGDGFVHGRDCDENDREIHELAKDAWYDGIDSDCDDADDFDQDADGERALQFGGTDCDDTNAGIHTGASEKAGDKVDADCDGLADPDGDRDGWPDSVDCDDADASTHPGAADAFYDGRDADCDGRSDFDADGDGYDSARHGGTDCDDTDAFISPATAEIAGDGIDQDCDGEDAAPVAEREPEGVTGRTASDADPVAPAFGTAPARAAMTTGCASTGATPVGGLVGVLAALGAMFGRRRQD